MKKLFITLFCTLLLTPYASAQVERMDPPFWWANMPVQQLQIQLYGENMGSYRAVVDYPGIIIDRQLAVDSPNYLFLYFNITPDSKPGTVDIRLSNGNDEFTLNYELKEREDRSGKNMGFDSSDLIYLMMPDRFANGDPSNDSIEGMLEKANRQDPTKRQGGDIAGVMEHLDYIDDLGMTAIWFTPMFENDMKPEYGAYHGYAATDLYKVDRRYGSNEEYKELVDAVHSRGMKVIMDMIHNHIGDQHWWMFDLPTNDWVHDFEKYGQTNFNDVVAADPYASKYDYEQLVNGWFVPEMPDLNQDNEILVDYLIQNTLWWIEYSGIDGIRMDTYIYPDKDYMARWSKEVLEAYPDFNIVGEAWVNNVPGEAYWQDDPVGVDDGYDSELPSVTDFPFTFAMRRAFSWDNVNLYGIYETLGQDFVYSDPFENVIFLDNHDMGRIYVETGEDEAEFKMLYSYLMTARGIPVVYYGTELMMGHEDRGGDDEAWRQTMPGGWPDDVRSVFTEDGRTEKENEILNYISSLNEWRKSAVAIHEGKLVHFIPRNNIYASFRIHEDQTVMVIMNGNEEPVTIPRDILAEVLDGFTTGISVTGGSDIDVRSDFEVPAKTTGIWELQY